MFDSGWLKKMIEEQKVKIAHKKIDENRVILTEPTEKLQKFVLKYVDDSEAFPNPTVLHRQEQ